LRRARLGTSGSLLCCILGYPSECGWGRRPARPRLPSRRRMLPAVVALLLLVHARTTRGWRANQVVAPGAGDVIVADSCGQSAFDAADASVCLCPTFGTMLPLGLLWVNCKLAAAGVRQTSCDGTPPNKLVEDRAAMTLCAAALPSQEFFRLVHYTMLAFQGCERTASDHASARVRSAVVKLVEEAKISTRSQQRSRAPLERLILTSADLVDAQRQLVNMSAQLRRTEGQALAASRSLAGAIVQAVDEHAARTAKLRDVSDGALANMREAAAATARMNFLIETAFSQFEEMSARKAALAQWAVYRGVLALAVCANLMLSVTVTRNEGEECWPSLLRLAFSSVTCFIVVACQEYLLGRRSVWLASTLCAVPVIVSCVDMQRLVRRAVGRTKAEASSKRTAATPALPDEDDRLSHDGFSFEAAHTSKARERLGPAGRSRDASPASTKSAASSASACHAEACPAEHRPRSVQGEHSALLTPVIPAALRTE
jgi:hypothetical protein